jgi:AraC family L-rhamnose operon transcriptional activator RhaR
MKHPSQTLTAKELFQTPFPIFINRVTEDFDLPLHSHDFIEFAYVAEGKGFHHIEDEVHPVYKGQLFVIPVGVSHVFRPTSPSASKSPLIVYNCVFTPPTIDRILEITADEQIAAHLATLKSRSSYGYSVNDQDGSIEKLFLKLHQEYLLPRVGSFTYLHTLLLQLIVDTYRIQSNAPFQVNPQKEATPTNQPLVQVLQYIETNYMENITLSSLADLCQWSERHLQRLFKLHTGQTFRSYLQNVRIQKSCEALRTTTNKITSIAEAVGYKDMDSFIGVFRRIVGKSPRVYRQQCRK